MPWLQAVCCSGHNTLGELADLAARSAATAGSSGPDVSRDGMGGVPFFDGDTAMNACVNNLKQRRRTQKLPR